MNLSINIVVKSDICFFYFTFLGIEFPISIDRIMNFLEKFDKDNWSYIKQENFYKVYKNDEIFDIHFYKEEMWCNKNDLISWFPRQLILNVYEEPKMLHIKYEEKEYSLTEYKSTVLWK